MSLHARPQVLLLSGLKKNRRGVLLWGGAKAAGLSANRRKSMASGDIRSEWQASSLVSLRSRPYLCLSRSLATISYRTSLLFDISISHPPMNLTPPVPPPTWDHSAEDIAKLISQYIQRNKTIQDKVGGLSSEQCNFESVSNLISVVGYFAHVGYLGVCEYRPFHLYL